LIIETQSNRFIDNLKKKIEIYHGESFDEECHAQRRFFPSTSCKWYMTDLITLVILNRPSQFGFNFYFSLAIPITFNFLNTKSSIFNYLFFTLALWYQTTLCLNASLRITVVNLAFSTKSKVAINPYHCHSWRNITPCNKGILILQG
jgi:hypothetical protein